jgi:hypothetical protein
MAAGAMTDPVTLTVVLRPAGGRELPPGGLTAATIGDGAPDPNAAERARAAFEERGFEVGPLVGIAFSITAPREHASDVFGELPDAGSVGLGGLPEGMRSEILAVEAEPPPDFGPRSF